MTLRQPAARTIGGKFMRYFIVILNLWIWTSSTWASDHIDGPATQKNRISDLADLYAFPTNGGASLAVVLNAHPIALPLTAFTSDVGYAIVLRKLEAQQDGNDVRLRTSDELRIRCQFEGRLPLSQNGTCKTSNGLTATARTKEISTAGDFRLFFGRRSDPFFFDGEWSEQVTNKGQLTVPSKENTLALMNVLSIVVELDRTQIFGGEFGLLAVAAESYELTSDGTPGSRLDRLGRPEITNVTLVAHAGEDDLRDQYNRADTFNLAPEQTKTFRARIRKNLKFYDGVDERRDWEDADTAQVARLLTEDYLIVDPAKPCAGNDYMEIERSILAARPHGTCGGRKLTDDVMDRIYTIYINNDKGEPIGDGVDRPDKDLSSSFPYLAEPATGPKAFAKAVAGRVITGR